MTKKSKKVTYVDEDGNDIPESEIDADEMEFTDEWERPVDANGVPLKEKLEESVAVEIGERMFKSGAFAELVEHCTTSLVHHPKSPALHSLAGVAHGSNGHAGKARTSFLAALQLKPEDPVFLANYLTACFDSGDKVSGIEGVRLFFSGLPLDGKSIVLETILEALKSGIISGNDLPKDLRALIEKESRAKKRIKVFNTQTGKLIEHWDYEEYRTRFAKQISRISPRGEAFSDEDLLDFLSHLNSYCRFEIERADPDN